MMATLRMSWRLAIRERSYACSIASPPEPDPPDPSADLERLTTLLFDLAVELLRRKGRFFPFGGVVWVADGTEQLVAAPPEKADARDPGGLLDALVAELREEAAGGRLRAAATCVGVRQDPDLGQAIRIDLEDATGAARVVLLQYERRFPRRFRISTERVERPGVPRVFAPEPLSP